MPQPFKVEVEVLREDLRGFSVSGELDQATADQLHAPLSEAIESGIRGVLIDLSDCEFIDSTGLRVLVQAQRQLSENSHSGRLIVCCPDPQVRRVLEITGLDEALDLHETRDEALVAITT
jgi:anti-sigma B factor antagonist